MPQMTVEVLVENGWDDNPYEEGDPDWEPDITVTEMLNAQALGIMRDAFQEDPDPEHWHVRCVFTANPDDCTIRFRGDAEDLVKIRDAIDRNWQQLGELVWFQSVVKD